MIRVTQAEFLRDTRALYQRARAERESIAVVGEWGEVRMQVDLGSGEPDGTGLARLRSATCGVCLEVCAHRVCSGPQFCVLCLREHGDHLELGLRELGADDE